MSVAIVLGGAKRALTELGEAELIAPNAPIIAVNDALRVAPRKPIAFATLHSEKAKQFTDGVDLRGVRLFAHAPAAGWDFELVQERFGGSSGLFATLIAIRQLGFAGVILAGVPLQS
ncbi:MAG TPA: hypothetical protein PLS69_06035, partial [Terricaulis sp.]|nr:hypothetical protein [Terricaulis sp.]